MSVSGHLVSMQSVLWGTIPRKYEEMCATHLSLWGRTGDVKCPPLSRLIGVRVRGDGLREMISVLKKVFITSEKMLPDFLN